MSCREFVELFLIEWLEGDLPAHRIRQCERHVGSCAHCRQYLTGYQSTMAAVAALRRAS